MPQDRTVRLVVELSVQAITQEQANELTRELVDVLGQAVTLHIERRNQVAINQIIQDIDINHEAYLGWGDTEGRSE